MQAAADQLSWIDRFRPSNLAAGMAGGLDSVSEWLKTVKTTVKESRHVASSESASTPSRQV